MKNLFLIAMVGVFSFLSVLEAEAGRGCRKARRSCGGGCYVQPCYTGNGCGAGGCAVNGGGTYVDPAAHGAAGQPGEVHVAPATPATP